eukprot:Filipodium_phascolosomae@DN1981_c0_g1_i4.p1
MQYSYPQPNTIVSSNPQIMPAAATTTYSQGHVVPQYGAPQYGTPQYGTPQYAAPQYGAEYAAPQYGAAAPAYPAAPTTYQGAGVRDYAAYPTATVTSFQQAPVATALSQPTYQHTSPMPTPATVGQSFYAPPPTTYGAPSFYGNEPTAPAVDASSFYSPVLQTVATSSTSLSAGGILNMY